MLRTLKQFAGIMLGVMLILTLYSVGAVYGAFSSEGYAADYDVEVTLTDGQDYQIHDSRTYHITTNGTITGIIRINSGCSPTIYLDKAKIDNSSVSGNGIMIGESSTLNLYLIGENVIKGGSRHPNSFTDAKDAYSGGAAGILVPANSALNIYSASDSGSLNVTGGNGNGCLNGSGGGAGIGTNGNYIYRGYPFSDATSSTASGKICIYSGTVSAKGGEKSENGGYGAGIGGGGGTGNNSDDSNYKNSTLGELYIHGGTVTAESGGGKADSAGSGSKGADAKDDDNPNQRIIVHGGTLNAAGVNYWTSDFTISGTVYGETLTSQVTAKFGEVSYSYNTGSTPVDCGDYSVTASVPASESYRSMQWTKPFSITPVQNSWIEYPAIEGWTFGDAAKTPSSNAKYLADTVEYTYSNSSDGPFTSDVPTNAGKWYMKASVPATNYYTGLSSVVEFNISQAAAPAVNVPSGLIAKHDDILSSVVLPAGWEWVEPTTKIQMSVSEYKARFTVDDSNYNYLGVEGYNSSGHYVERDLSIVVSKADSSVTITTSNMDKTYDGNPVSDPSVTKTGSTNEILFTWFEKDSDTWKTLSSAPKITGDYKVIASVKADDNYNSAEAEKEFVINKASVTNEGKTKEITYDGNTIDVSGLFTKDANAGTPSYSLITGEEGVPGMGNLDGSALTVEDTGIFKIKMTTAETDNFNSGDATATLTVKDGVIEYVVSDNGGVYDVMEHGITVEVQSPEDTKITYSTDGINYSEKNPQFKDAGTNTVYFRIDKKNYTTAENSREITITPRDIADAKVTLGTTLYYNGREQTQTIESVKVGDMDVTFTVTGNSATTSGRHEMTITGTGNFAGEIKVEYTIAVLPVWYDTVTNSGSGNNIVTNVDASDSTVVKDNKAETKIDAYTGRKIVDNAIKNGSAEVIIKANTGKEGIVSSTVSIPASVVKELAEKTTSSVTIKTDNVSVSLDKSALDAIANQAGTDGDVKFIVEIKESNKNKVEVDLKLLTSQGTVSDFKGGNVTVTVSISQELSKKKPVCVYIDEDGRYHKIGGTLNANGTFTFVTGHFSTYVIMAEEEADTVIAAQQKEEILAKLDSYELVARSMTCKSPSGKNAIRIRVYDKNGLSTDFFDGIEIYRSTKSNSGYGKKPVFVIRSGKSSYYNTAIKSGTKYYYRVRGFVIIDGQKYYTDYSLKAIRTAK